MPEIIQEIHRWVGFATQSLSAGTDNYPTVAGESGPESIARDQCVLVKAPDSGDGVHIDIDPAAQWKAKVLEVRALNPEHVYLRVAWLNRPEDLPGGREPHHGRNELIPTNQMDIIDAMTVNGAIEVAHWDQYDDESPSFQDQYYWRQTMDFLESGNKKFSVGQIYTRSVL